MEKELAKVIADSNSEAVERARQAAAEPSTLDRIGEHPKAYVMDLSQVPVLDSSAAATIAGFARRVERQGAAVVIAGADRAVRRMLLMQGVRPPVVRFRSTLADAVAAGRIYGERARAAA